jgi:hypothetical protein
MGSRSERLGHLCFEFGMYDCLDSFFWWFRVIQFSQQRPQECKKNG